MKHVTLTNGLQAIVDDEDYDVVTQYRWRARLNKGRTCYATTTVRDGNRYVEIHMHRLIMGLPRGSKYQVDHINRDTLDNRKENLRIASNRQNSLNRAAHKDNKTGYKGVCFNKRLGKYIAQITMHGRVLHLGVHPDPVSAARAYDAAAKQYYGKYAYLNNV